jgi:hypothetical protein
VSWAVFLDLRTSLTRVDIPRNLTFGLTPRLVLIRQQTITGGDTPDMCWHHILDPRRMCPTQMQNRLNRFHLNPRTGKF